jgi:hypothetical protein
MTLRSRFVRVAAGLALAGIFAFGAAALVTEAVAAKCSCGISYAPVRCSDGKTYQNQCYATCAGATGCVPIGPPPR